MGGFMVVYEWSLREIAAMFDVTEPCIRYHIRKKHIFPKRIFRGGRQKYIFTLQDVKSLKEHLLKEILYEAEN